MAPKKGKKYSVTFALPTAQKIEELAEKEGRTISQMIAKLCEDALQARGDL